MAILKIKHEKVNVWGLDEVMRPVLAHASRVWSRHGQELVVTSARDGLHSPGSLHYYGKAVDLRTRYFGKEQVLEIAREMRDLLGQDYDVVVHSTHLHIEYDPKGGERSV